MRCAWSPGAAVALVAVAILAAQVHCLADKAAADAKEVRAGEAAAAAEGDEEDDAPQDISLEELQQLQEIINANQSIKAFSTEKMQKLHGIMDGDSDGRVSVDELKQFESDTRTAMNDRDVARVNEAMDKDNDGLLSLQEMLNDLRSPDDEDPTDKEERIEHEKAKFGLADLNGDGVLDKSEFPALLIPELNEATLSHTVGRSFKQMDSDKNGLLSVQEFYALGEDFKKLDRDGDGSLNLEELKRWESGEFHKTEAIRQLFAIGDKDADQHITSEELDGAREEFADHEVHHQITQWLEHHEL